MTAPSNDGFTEVSPARRGTRFPIGLPSGTLKLSPSNIYITEAQAEELGITERVAISVNAKKAMIRLKAAPIHEKDSYMIRHNTFLDGGPGQISTKHPTSVQGSIPLGYYLHVGGGVFQYKGKTKF